MSKKKPSKDTKGERLEIRLETAEKEAFQLAAQLDGRSVSNWIVQVCRAAAREAIEGADKPVPFTQKGK